ncbi:ScbA/BarX family gamma-butyrolactone biosynthesis protein [Allostreptomyces psammosilenae]|uniref:A-factor biosynthesis hotdog domain-containing protein n=1 Tax=Allostreptomyces psammosilenae TaxID=1892865 RepID=A0A852ZRA0_9ACTN|nr:ScbA/BarX family gamma-butyrolactone biosynthesis protein [Allostreptomyces psammosilenae]NYI04899.1 hypothetical protein [Allostreptomyces psammosilenae]
MQEHQLSFERTVKRSLVHRRAVNEVFVTDLRDVDSSTFLVGAQLPMSHAYFLDHASGPPRYTLPLLTECCRQAATIVAHERHGVPFDWTFLMMDTSARLTNTAPLLVGERPTELTITVGTEVTTSRGGEVRGLRHTFAMAIGGERVGHGDSVTRYVTNEEYEFMRAAGRTGTPPLSTTLPETVGGLVVPYLVGRRDPRNVVLADCHTTEDGALQARLAVSGRHPTYFDHPLDHYTGMVLTEAAIQAGALAAAAEGEPAVNTTVVGLEAGFKQFLELDDDVVVRARAGKPEDDADVGRVLPVEIEFTQGGAERARVRLLTTSDGERSWR